MHRFFLIIVFTLIFLSFPLHAQDPKDEPNPSPSQEQIAEARLQYIAGDHGTALLIIIPAAVAGDANAQNILGAAYEDGKGVAPDLASAQAWWEKAAAQEFDKALYNLGRLHASDRPDYPTDHKRAAAYLDRAIALGYSEAFVDRARLHELGRGGPVDDVAAAGLYRQAVELGNLRAMSRLGNMHVEGRGVEEDLPRALALFGQAAMLGDATGLSNLGAMYEHGYAVGRDLVAALALYEKAAGLGNPQAAVNLGYLLAGGRIGWADPVGGYAWCLVAVERAHPGERGGFEADCAELGKGLDETARTQANARAGELMH